MATLHKLDEVILIGVAFTCPHWPGPVLALRLSQDAKALEHAEKAYDLRAVFDEVARKRMPYVLARGSRPETALIL